MKTVYAVGLGPGSLALLTPEAREVIGHCDTIAGYKTYLEQIPELLAGKRIIANGMRQEVDRCRAALEAANAGAEVAVISSGDAGIYGMAGLLLELAESEEFRGIEIRVVPGVTAASAAAALVGAPLMCDFCASSVSPIFSPTARSFSGESAPRRKTISSPRSTTPAAQNGAICWSSPSKPSARRAAMNCPSRLSMTLHARGNGSPSGKFPIFRLKKSI